MIKPRILLCLNIGLIIFLILTYYNTFIWMEDRWRRTNSYYSHGYLVPFVSAFLIWKVRRCFHDIAYSPSRLGIILFSIGVFVQVVSAFTRVHFTSAISFIIVLVGIIFYLFGKDIGRKLLFPVLFLVTMAPMPLSAIAGLTLKLKLFATECSMHIIDLIGIPAIQDGSRIIFANCTILVADACSGLRSLIALISFGALFAFMFGVSNYMKPILFMSSIPAALVANIVRIVSVSLVANRWGTEGAESIHGITGILIFLVAFTLLFSFGIGLLGIDRLLTSGEAAPSEKS